MTKIIGSIIIIAVFTYMGMSAPSKIKIKAQTADMLSADLKVLCSRIKNFNEPLAEAFKKPENCRILWEKCENRIKEGGSQFSEIWEDVLNEMDYEKEIKTEMYPLGAILGISVAEDEENAIISTARRLDEIRTKSEAEYKEKRGLYSRLGASAGLFIVILLI